MSDEHPIAKRSRSVTLHASEKEFAIWLAQHKYAPPLAKQVEKAREVMGYDVDEARLRKLKQRKAFKDFYGYVAHQSPREAVDTARELIDGRAPYVADTHVQAIENLKKLGQWKEVAKFTNPLLDRYYPKTDATALQATQINITISPEQQALIEAVPVETSYEIINDDSTST